MNETGKSIVLAVLLLVTVSLACSVSVVTPAATPVPTASLTQTITPSETVVPTETVPAASATPEFAPFCGQDTSTVSSPPQCQIPAAEESSTFCSEKDPYNLILIDKGLTYKVLTDGFRCSDAGTKDDKQMLTCTGQFATDFVLSVCDPGCVVPTVQSAVTNCPQGFNFDNARGCCTDQAQVLDQNCMAFKFKTASCVVRCFEFKREGKCKKNSWACVWNDKDKICELRK